jgi:hypothetical protein
MRNHHINSWKIWIALITTLVLAFGSRTLLRAGELPPRPTPEPAPTLPTTETSKGGESLASIALYATFPSTWPWYHLHGQQLLTVVQWQDEDGFWHDVEGWRGGFDRFDVNVDGSAVGIKTWWLAEQNFGAGPFRWIVYRDADRTQRLVTSEVFDLPGRDGSQHVVSLDLPVPTDFLP